MIKNTFYNLPEEKRKRITDAIFNEFAGSSGERVSINNIIKNANISRGSFYQYFDDKVDLVEVMTRSFINFSLEKATEVISRTHGDIFVTYDLLFEILCECSKDAKQSIIMKNLIKNIMTVLFRNILSTVSRALQSLSALQTILTEVTLNILQMKM